MNVSTSYTHTGTRSSNTLSVPSLTMSRISVYKPPRSSPLAGPAISVDIDDDDDDEDHDGDDDGDTGAESRRNEKSRASATHSRLSSPYPTPPRTPSPSSDYSVDDAQGAKTMAEIGAGSIEPSSKTWSKSHGKQPRPSAPLGTIETSSRPLGSHPDEPSTRRSSRAYVRTPFSAPPTMPDFHPSYDTNAISVRPVQRPRTAPGTSSSATSSSVSCASPAERGAFSAPGIIKSTAARGRHEVPNTQSNSGCDCKASAVSSSSSPKLNWITVSNNSPPPFSRTLLTQSVVMPVKATEAEVKRSTRRPKTTSNSQIASISALSGFQVQEVDDMPQPVPITKSSKEERWERNYQPGPFPLPSHDENANDRRMSKEIGNKVEGPGNGEVLRENEVELKAGPEERRTGAGGGKWKLKLFLKTLRKADL